MRVKIQLTEPNLTLCTPGHALPCGDPDSATAGALPVAFLSEVAFALELHPSLTPDFLNQTAPRILKV